jgi:hypothetical protein
MLGTHPADTTTLGVVDEWHDVGDVLGSHRGMYFGLDGHDPVPVSLMEWATQYELRFAAIELGDPDPWSVAVTDFDGGAHLSTVFLGMNHNYFGGPPILFETMLFGSEVHVGQLFGGGVEYHEDLGQWRYCTWDEAAAGHEAIAGLFLQEIGDTAGAEPDPE